jgi:hypothetical protein
VAAHPWRSILDLQASFEQIRVDPDHVSRNAATTPDGNILSKVMMQGDCNAPATQQTLMGHLFSPYMGRFLDVYLDDIIIYSDTIEQHIEHVKLVFGILERERMYLSKDKLQFLPDELNVLGHVIGEDGIRMDSDKVDSVINWKTPTNRDLLRGFLGSVGYLADNVPGVRIPMGILSAITGDTVPFKWTYTEQRAFEDVKRLVQEARDLNRIPLSYAEGASPIWMITDGCATGISGVIAQGEDWKTSKIAGFYSAKLNPAQQNYATHEIELFAGIETMLRNRDLLQGVRFKWVTDHKGLTYFLNQKNLSGRQARWLEKISSFDFEVVYVPGNENVIADALSRMYSNDAPGTVRARSEYTYHDVVDDDVEVMTDELPILAGLEAIVETKRRKRKEKPPAESGRPETSKEFAARMKDGFVLKGPSERKEGGIPVTQNATHDSPATTSSTTQNEQLPSGVDVNRNAPQITDLNLEHHTLVDLVNLNLDGIDLLKELRGKTSEDAFFKIVLEKPDEYRNFKVKNELLYLTKKDQELLCIPKAMIRNRSAREIVISEGHSLLAHLGASKTLDYLRDHVWWPDMVSDVKAFCETCSTCKKSKPSNQKPYGLLNPLSTPGQPWESIGVDFVGPLPRSKNRDNTYDEITVIICLLTAMVHLVPSRTNYTAPQMAELMFEAVYRHHGIPKNIISDRDVLFTSVFWKHLHDLLGSKLRMSSAYHPQTDGATERANRTVTQMLRQCVNGKQTDWVAKLPAIEFAINSARSESTGFSPFFLNTGRMPRSMLFNFPVAQNEYPSVRNFASLRRIAIMAAHDSIITARVKQTRDANRKRRIEPFTTGDFVYLSSKNITFPKGLARKLIPKYIGPYKILQDFGNHSYRLELTKDLKSRGIHDVFHASLLRVHVPNDDRLFPGRLDTQLGTDETYSGEWAVERILSHAGSGKDSMLEVKWTAGDVTWLPYDRISGLQAVKSYLDTLGIEKISELPKGDGKPPGDDPQVYLGTIPSVHDQFSPAPIKTSTSFRSFLSPLSSFLHRCLPCLSTIEPSDDTIITCPRMETGPTSDHGTSPTFDNTTHPLIELTQDGEYRVKCPPGDQSSEAPRGQIFTKNMLIDYIAYSDRCNAAALAGVIEDIQNLLNRAPAGYETFAEFYNEHAEIQNNEFSVYNDELDSFTLVPAPVNFKNFGIIEIDPTHQTAPKNSTLKSTKGGNRARDRKPYKPRDKKFSQSLSSILQRAHNFGGVDGLFADLLMTSASQQASNAKMGTMHFGKRQSKRQQSQKVNHSKNKLASSSTDEAGPSSKIIPTESMDGIEVGPSSTSPT